MNIVNEAKTLKPAYYYGIIAKIVFLVIPFLPLANYEGNLHNLFSLTFFKIKEFLILIEVIDGELPLDWGLIVIIEGEFYSIACWVALHLQFFILNIFSIILFVKALIGLFDFNGNRKRTDYFLLKVDDDTHMFFWTIKFLLILFLMPVIHIGIFISVYQFQVDLLFFYPIYLLLYSIISFIGVLIFAFGNWLIHSLRETKKWNIYYIGRLIIICVLLILFSVEPWELSVGTEKIKITMFGSESALFFHRGVLLLNTPFIEVLFSSNEKIMLHFITVMLLSIWYASLLFRNVLVESFGNVVFQSNMLLSEWSIILKYYDIEKWKINRKIEDKMLRVVMLILGIIILLLNYLFPLLVQNGSEAISVSIMKPFAIGLIVSSFFMTVYSTIYNHK